jgi:hypothetical protein
MPHRDIGLPNMWFAPGVGADRVARSVAERLARALVSILGLAPAARR